MLELLIVKPKQECWDQPIVVTVSAEMLDRNDGERLTEVALQRYAVQSAWVICGRVELRV
ncbi:hypothetical protein CQ12_37840 [Bradyrhizobium jicamae]|uniref:Uncharacterized protein n=1 Tax=Bradyrhizobium jicamae TaxID=280332 RepID=A0A0R3LZZ6_9BRAD|nr:hypothetical protein CQ12_37840 [Bradyrhizobium jicamae]